MKKTVTFRLLLSLLLVVASGCHNRSHLDPPTKYIYTDYYPTPDLNGVTGGAGCNMSIDGTACYEATELVLVAPDSKWVFDGNPSLECEEPAVVGSSTVWNHLDRSTPELIKEHRLTITLNNPNIIKATLLTGSGTVHVRLKCLATYYPSSE
jgi:hypothetical protein